MIRFNLLLFIVTRKYLLCGYILGVLTYTTASYQHLETQLVFPLPDIVMYIAWLGKDRTTDRQT